MELNLAGDNTQSPLLTRLLEVKREVEEASDLGTDRVYMSQPNGDFRRTVTRDLRSRTLICLSTEI